jgi:hypothetical protein
MKTKEQIRAYNKEYFARPEVKARAKLRNANYRLRRKLYKKTPEGRAAENAYRRRSYAKVSDKKRSERYGLEPGAFERMLDDQHGKCLICSTYHGRLLHVDHDHTTGRVRGLLCGSCNRAIGLLKDDKTRLLSAVAYLSRYV